MVVILENSLAVMFTHFPYDPVFPLPGIYPSELKTYLYENNSLQMFIVALLIITKLGNNSDVLLQMNGFPKTTVVHS